ncbi:MAG: pseudouridine synthase, partial [Magnetococcales bacterium]|nr:pseudouridine synthase [Magnetococcales bacterium]
MTAEAVRLQKWLAESGLCSRREGEEWILQGRVTINGEVIKQLGSKVNRGDQVLVDGRVAVPLREPLRVMMLHKPAGVVCTRKDPENRENVFSLLGEGHARLISIGRLDYNSEGLLLFTNHGELAHRLMHPSTQIDRTYRVRVHGRIDPPTLSRLQAGVMLEDGPTGPLNLSVDQVVGANSWLTITLQEGRNRIVRRIFAAFEMDVSRLIRVQYGSCQLGDLPRGQWRALLPQEIKALLAPLPGAAAWWREPKKAPAATGEYGRKRRLTTNSGSEKFSPAERNTRPRQDSAWADTAAPTMAQSSHKRATPRPETEKSFPSERPARARQAAFSADHGAAPRGRTNPFTATDQGFASERPARQGSFSSERGAPPREKTARNRDNSFTEREESFRGERPARTRQAAFSTERAAPPRERAARNRDNSFAEREQSFPGEPPARARQAAFSTERAAPPRERAARNRDNSFAEREQSFPGEPPARARQAAFSTERAAPPRERAARNRDNSFAE